MEVTQIAACNRLHEVEERLARWLLMSADRIGSNSVPLTQEFLAQMIGTRRSSVTVAAGVLQRAGLITYSRGDMKIIDREKWKKHLAIATGSWCGSSTNGKRKKSNNCFLPRKLSVSHRTDELPSEE